MDEKQNNSSRWLTLRLRPEEYQQIKDRFNKTMFRKLSEYTRSVLLAKPVTVVHRDQSMDEVLEELILLRKELNAIGNNLNQAVRNINSVKDQTQGHIWISLLSIIGGELEPNISQIKKQMDNYAELWSQKLRVEKV